MWHLNIPVFRNLHKVAEHERGALWSLNTTWWGFGNNLPRAFKKIKQKKGSPYPNTAEVAAAVSWLKGGGGNAAPPPPEELELQKGRFIATPTGQLLEPIRASTGKKMPPAKFAEGLEDIDVGMEVMQRAVAGVGRRGVVVAGHDAETLIDEHGFVRTPPKPSMAWKGVFKIVQKG
eukprot:gnl/TRDRNA2_/TRDRNA2_202505_c0_seq1.p1 gnl/TRDRNA2_/TRDRNA2_202505_c0~~gnl/TRDRNA2_/TRDRNA2_202505_c0_seq1.p1  ORF type:complete len:176 (+),score=45.73 gnl/TRDRNA2_/TRDRNA2_202505_c0_seq1:48-575(+)